MNTIAYSSAHVLTLSLEDTFPEVIPQGITNICVMIPAGNDNVAKKLVDNKFFFADRTLKTLISLSKIDTTLQKLVRFQIITGAEYTDDINNIAYIAFSMDRRFHLKQTYDMDHAKQIIEGYINTAKKLGYPLVTCIYKEKVIGFISLKPESDKNYFIYLAAVHPDYQKTGAAVSLYVSACCHALKLGASQLTGRISAANTAVMNIYILLHAKFSEPWDIYLKEMKLSD